MAAKITAFLLTVTVCIIAAVISLFVLLLAMNGFSESDAMWGLGAFIVLSVLVSILSGFGAVIMAARLIAKQFTPVRSLLIAVPVFSIVGTGLVLVSSLVGVGVTEFVRVNF